MLLEPRQGESFPGLPVVFHTQAHAVTYESHGSQKSQILQRTRNIVCARVAAFYFLKEKLLGALPEDPCWTHWAQVSRAQ